MWYKYVPVVKNGKTLWYNTGIVAYNVKPTDKDDEKWLRPWESGHSLES